MTPETISIYISIAKIQAKRRDNWLPGFPIDRDLEYAHQSDLAILREQLEATPPTAKPSIPIKAKPSMANAIFKALSNLFPRKLL